mgnify:CR=1 FL=1
MAPVASGCRLLLGLYTTTTGTTLHCISRRGGPRSFAFGTGTETVSQMSEFTRDATRYSHELLQVRAAPSTSWKLIDLDIALS